MSEHSPDRVLRIRRQLLGFFDREARDLPWRGEPEPYGIWISEVMLQQTRVDTVIGYYRRWMDRFPTVDALAGAEMEEVLQQWKGLGYYSRARNLRDAAVVLRDRHGSELPAAVARLRELPGVGEYTAGAVASIAFGVPTPAVDGNVRRVLSRLFDLADPGGAELRELAGALVDPERPGDFNQALMELGATVCTPRSPGCAECAVRDDCRALAAGTVGERPPARKRSPSREIDVGVAVVVRRSPAPGPAAGGERLRVLLRRRPDGGLLPGLWEFPGEEIEGEEGAEEAALRAFERCVAVAGAPPPAAGAPAGVAAGRGSGRPLPDVRHLFSHLSARYRPVLFLASAEDADACAPGDAPAGGGGRSGVGVRWVAVDALDSVPLPRAQQRIGTAMIEALAALTPPRRDRSPGTPSSDPRDVPSRSRPRRSG